MTDTVCTSAALICVSHTVTTYAIKFIVASNEMDCCTNSREMLEYEPQVGKANNGHMVVVAHNERSIQVSFRANRTSLGISQFLSGTSATTQLAM